MEPQSLQAQIRTQAGKGAARRLRGSGRLPAVFYGKGLEPRMLSVSPKDMSHILSTEYGRNVLIKLALQGGEQLAMIKELQTDPISRSLLHVDFYRVQLASPVVVRVPFRAAGRAKGVLAGGEMNIVFREVPIRANPENIPTHIEGDVTELEINEMLRVQDLQLPDGVSILLPPDQTLVAILAEREEEPEAVEVAAVAEGEAEEKPEGEAEGEEQGKDEPGKPDKGKPDKGKSDKS